MRWWAGALALAVVCGAEVVQAFVFTPMVIYMYIQIIEIGICMHTYIYT